MNPMLTKEQKSSLYKSYRDKKIFDKYQLTTIRSGINKNLDVSVYADIKYNHGQMLEIMFAMEQELEYNYLLDETYPDLLMNFIRSYLYTAKEDGIKVNYKSVKEGVIYGCEWRQKHSGMTQEHCDKLLSFLK